MECAEILDNGQLDDEKKHKELKDLIYNISPKTTKKNDVQNTGDIMIERFHKANFESPVFFSKNNDFIKGHHIRDAEAWLTEKKTDDRETRWLLMSASKYVTTLFESNNEAMINQVMNIFKDINTDPGLYSGFSQLYNLFYGLRNFSEKGPYYQAISAMLVPFDNKIDVPKNAFINSTTSYDIVQKLFARFSKQCRNYCAHNYFGTYVSNETALFIMMCTLTGLLNKKQRTEFDQWFTNAGNRFNNRDSYKDLIPNNLKKVDALGKNLLEQGDIDIASDEIKKLHINNKCWEDYTPWKMLRALGYNEKMNVKNQPDPDKREKYFVFTLASYIVKIFSKLKEDDIRSNFGKGIEIIYHIANEIVSSYNYPS